MYDWHVPASYLETLRAGYQHSEYWPVWETLRATAFTVAPDGSAYGLAQTESGLYFVSVDIKESIEKYNPYLYSNN